MLIFAVTVGVMAYLASKGAPPGPTPSPGGPDPGTGDTASGGQGQDVGGIKCESHEQLVYHVHAHLSILVDGQPQPVSAQIGIPGGPLFPKCYYWLHTHDTSSIIHIESPSQQKYTLGQFFDIWGQPLSNHKVAVYDVPGGVLTAYVNGQPVTGDPRDITLDKHTLVVLEAGKQVTPPGFDFPGGL